MGDGMPEEATELSITDVLIHYKATSVPYGAGWKTMRCPFHHDKVASGRVNVGLDAYKCHGCKVSGNSALKVIQNVEHLNEGDAIEFARQILGKSVTNVPQPISGQKKRRPLGSEKWKEILG